MKHVAILGVAEPRYHGLDKGDMRDALDRLDQPARGRLISVLNPESARKGMSKVSVAHF